MRTRHYTRAPLLFNEKLGRELASVGGRDADGTRSRVCEMLAFDDEGRVVRGEVMRGADLS
jgi:hypothetical protein